MTGMRRRMCRGYMRGWWWGQGAEEGERREGLPAQMPREAVGGRSKKAKR